MRRFLDFLPGANGEERVITDYTVRSPLLKRTHRLLLMADLHNGGFEDLLPLMDGAEAVLFPGDLLDRHHPGMAHVLAFLQEAPEHAPVYFSSGNHEWKSRDAEDFRRALTQSGVILMDSRVEHLDEIALGGLGSAPKKRVDADFPKRFAREDGFRLLLCHHPEWYRRYIAGTGIDLTVSGHAHGGQVQLGGHGLYSPGQGAFPRWTDGFYEDGRLLVTRGLTNSSHWAPRINNPVEVVRLTLEAERT